MNTYPCAELRSTLDNSSITATVHRRLQMTAHVRLSAGQDVDMDGEEVG